MPFEIIRNDITRVKADAVVNTANPNPIIGDGTDSAIHRAAGPRLLAARQKIGTIAVGTSVQTPAFDLPAKYVLHTVSPAWTDGTQGEEDLLLRAYNAALSLADRLHCRSVAFPLLSAGSYGFPQEVALSVAIRAFTDFLLTHDLSIILVVFGQEPFSLARGLFGDLRAYIDDRYVGEAETVEYGDAAIPYGARRSRDAREIRARRDPFIQETRRVGSRRPENAQTDEVSCCHELSFESEEPRNKPKKTFAVPTAVNPKDIERLLNGAENTFSEHLLDLLNECGEKDSDVYRRAEISRQLFHKIIHKKDYQPTKSTAIQLAIGLRLGVAETQKLLEKAGYSLSRSSKADLVVQYYIERGVYNIVEINTALYDCDLPLLRTSSVL